MPHEPRPDASNRYLVILFELALKHGWSFDGLLDCWRDNSLLPPGWIPGCTALAREMGLLPRSTPPTQRSEIIPFGGGDAAR